MLVSDHTIAEFNRYECSLDDAFYAFQFVETFEGEGKKSYPLCYDSVHCNAVIFKNLSSRSLVILGFEVANSVLPHLNGSITSESLFLKICEFTEKEENRKCFSKSVMKTLYFCLRKPTQQHVNSNIKHASTLLARKDSSDSATKDNTFTNIKNRCDLWKVSAGVFDTFLFFRYVSRFV